MINRAIGVLELFAPMAIVAPLALLTLRMASLAPMALRTRRYFPTHLFCYKVVLALACLAYAKQSTNGAISSAPMAVVGDKHGTISTN